MQIKTRGLREPESKVNAALEFLVFFSSPAPTPPPLQDRAEEAGIEWGFAGRSYLSNGKRERRGQHVPAFKGMNEYGVFWKSPRMSLAVSVGQEINTYGCQS